MQNLGTELERIPFGRMLAVCDEIVTTVTEENHDPLVTTPGRAT